MKHTMSLCPECRNVVDAVVFEENGRMLIEKTCDEHGTFKDVYWSDADMYNKFENYSKVGIGLSNPHITKDSSCPQTCGICPQHTTSTILANIDVTNRCNLNCPVCFANAKTRKLIYEPSFEQIRQMLETLRNEQPVPCAAVQFSGGEPTMREDLVEIVEMARDMGFLQIQIATNGIKLAKDLELGIKLYEAGLHTVYMGFDGVTEEPYIKTRNFNAFPIKEKAIENCRKSGLVSVALVPTLARGVNDHQVGDIIRYAADRLDVVKGINFQPVAFTGRIDQDEREKSRITIPDLIKLAEEQTNGEIHRDAWKSVSFIVPMSRFLGSMRNKHNPEPTCHHHCGIGTYAFKEGDRLIPITDFVDVEGMMEYLDDATQQVNGGASKLLTAAKVVGKIPSFIDKKKGPKSINVTKLLVNLIKDGGEEVAKQFHRNSLFIGCMHFQDLYNFDIERAKRCAIHYATPDGRVIPFCTYNTLHREEVEAKFSRPYEP